MPFIIYAKLKCIITVTQKIEEIVYHCEIFIKYVNWLVQDSLW